MTLHLGFTGTRKAVTREQDDKLCQVFSMFDDLHNDVVLHHGDRVGADKHAHNMAVHLFGWRAHIHPPKNSKYRAFCQSPMIEPQKDYLERSRDIVDAVDALVAVPNGVEKVRSGTWATVRYARQRGLFITIIYPDGEIAAENL